MPDNTHEEHLDNSQNTQSENHPYETTPAKDTEPVNPSHNIENMEVHHHPDLHHKTNKIAMRFMNNNYPLLNYDKNLWQQLRNWAYSSSRNYRVEIQLFNAARLQAITAIAALKKEHHLL